MATYKTTMIVMKILLLEKNEVESCLSHEEWVNIVFDESKDRAGHRISNMSLVTRLGAFYYLTDAVGETRQTAENFAVWAMQRMGQSVQGNYARINSVATDICSDMRAVWRKIKADPRTSHVFCVPCDSHGLQLLIGDLVDKIPTLKSVKDDAEAIATAFRNSPLQYAILRRHQEACYEGRRKAFVIAVATRWGTQAGLVDSDLGNKDALMSYVDDPVAGIRQSVVYIIRRPHFWFALSELSYVLAPIHVEQKLSEGTEADVGLVWERWDKLEAHIRSCTQTVNLFEDQQEWTMELVAKRRDTYAGCGHASCRLPAEADDDAVRADRCPAPARIQVLP
jgi:hypothetical protein